MKRKRILMITFSIILIWLAAGVINFTLVKGFYRPIFCVCIEPMQDGGSGRYVGLGYSFDIEGNFTPDTQDYGVTSCRGYIPSKEVSRGFWERMLPGDGKTE